MLFRNLNRISWPLIYLRVNILNPRLQQPNTIRWDNLVLKTKSRSSIQILPRSVFLLSPLGPLWARFPYKFSRNLKTKLGRISLPSISKLLSLRLPLLVTLLLRSVCTVSRLPLRGLKARFRRVPILKERGCDNTCDYFDIMNKRILIQQRALACLSKSVAHILQKELYTMGNTSLLRREAEMTLLQPHLWNSRCQELRNSPFWPTPLFRSQSRMEKTSSFKKAPLKTRRVLDPIKTSPFVVPTTIRKETATGNAPMGPIPPKAVINRFPQVGGNRTTEASEVIFDPPKGTRAWKPLLPMTPYKPPSVHQ